MVGGADTCAPLHSRQRTTRPNGSPGDRGASDRTRWRGTLARTLPGGAVQTGRAQEATAPTVIVLPLLSAIFGALCAIAVARDAARSPRPDKVAWGIAFALFAVAATAAVVGDLAGWSETLVRVYYLAGAVLVVGYLALGELYLLAGERMRRVGPGLALLVTALAATLVSAAPIDPAHLEADGWEALERGGALMALTISLNAGGTTVLVGGLVYSAVRFRRSGANRSRMIGVLLIAVGTIVVGLGGTATRLGSAQVLYIFMSAGIATIFAGYLATRRPDGEPLIPRRAVAPSAANTPRPVASPGRASAAPAGADPAIAYIEALLLDDADIAIRCAEWSVPRDDAPTLARAAAIDVWRLRVALSPAGQARLDAAPVATRRQLATLWAEVLCADLPSAAPSASV